MVAPTNPRFDNGLLLINKNPKMAIKPLSHHEAIGYHEGLHHGGIGSTRIANLKTSKVYKSEKRLLEDGHLPEDIDYILEAPGEGVVNTLDDGFRLGLEIGQSYPGKSNFKNLLETSNIGFKQNNLSMYKLDNSRDYKRV